METSFERVRAATACGPKKLKLISERKKSLRQLCPYRSRTSQPDSDIKSRNCRRRSRFSMGAQCTKKCFNCATHDEKGLNLSSAISAAGICSPVSKPLAAYVQSGATGSIGPWDLP